jgi:hypothetical protein
LTCLKESWKIANSDGDKDDMDMEGSGLGEGSDFGDGEDDGQAKQDDY